MRNYRNFNIFDSVLSYESMHLWSIMHIILNRKKIVTLPSTQEIFLCLKTVIYFNKCIICSKYIHQQRFFLLTMHIYISDQSVFDCTDVVYINIMVNQPNDLEWHSLKMSTQISSRLVDPRDIIMFVALLKIFFLLFFAGDTSR